MENYINYEKNMKMLSQAVKYCEENFLHDEIIQELKLDNDLKKQLCIIELKKLNNQQEADILTENLINKPGPVRETVSYKILDLIPFYQDFFQTKNITDIFVKAISDINPSVSRNVIEIIKYIYDVDYLYQNILKEIKITLENINTEEKNRSYVINKKNFKLYWNLEALISIYDKIPADDELSELLKLTSNSNDYTIREKTAKTASLLSAKNPKFKEITDILADDINIYVRRYVN